MIYHSRRDRSIALLYFGIMMLGFFLLIYSVLSIINQTGEIILYVFNGIVGLIVSLLMILIYANTFYELKNRTLFIRSGPFTDDIYYKKIEKIEKKTKFGLGSALAKDRLLLYCGKRKNGRPNIVQISPQRPDEFLKKIMKNAPHIEIYNK